MAVLNLFAGTGWSVALKAMGRNEYAVENNTNVKFTRWRNSMENFVDDAWDDEAINTRHYDTILASPPCQTFSTTGNGKGYGALDMLYSLIGHKQYQDIEELRRVSFTEHDDRIGLVLLPLHYVEKNRPEFAVFEQVQPVQPLWNAMVPELQMMGYSTWTGTLRAEQHGVPQVRKRAFLIASRYQAAEPPPVTHSKFYQRDTDYLDPGVQKWVSMEEALGTEPFVARWPYSGSPTRKYADRWDWERQSRGSMLRRSDHPALTLTSKIPHILPHAPDSYIPTAHVPDTARTMTVEEAKALMTYPKRFEFVGGKKSTFQQIGNAVPPLLAEKILTHLWRKP